MPIIKLEDYDKYEGINYSTLSKMSIDPRRIDPDYIKSKPTEAMDLGSLVDVMLFTPDDIKTRFHFSKVEKPGDQIGLLLDNYMASGGKPVSTVAELDLELIAKCRENIGGGWGKWGTDAVANAFVKACGPYFEDYVAAGDRRVIDLSLAEAATKATTQLQTCTVWDLPNLLSGPGEREIVTKNITGMANIQYQVPIAWEYMIGKDVFKCKSLLDIMVTSEDGTKIDILDLKVVGDNPRDFYKKWLTWNYHIQASMYVAAVNNMMMNKGIHVNKVTFSFIVASPIFPVIKWNMTDGQITLGEKGGMLATGHKVKGFSELITQLNWHRLTGQYQYSPSELNDTNTFSLRIV